MERLFVAAKTYKEQLSKLPVCCLSSPQVPELGGPSLPSSDLSVAFAAAREKESFYLSTGECLLSCDVSRSSLSQKKTNKQKYKLWNVKRSYLQPAAGKSHPLRILLGFHVWDQAKMLDVNCWALERSLVSVPSRFSCSPVGMCSVSLLPFPKKNRKVKKVRPFVDTRKSLCILFWSLCSRLWYVIYKGLLTHDFQTISKLLPLTSLLQQPHA